MRAILKLSDKEYVTIDCREGDGENCMMRNFVISTPCLMLLGLRNEERLAMTRNANKKNAYKFMLGKREGRSLGRTRRRWEGTIKIILK
jgi:hypothetical protein